MTDPSLAEIWRIVWRSGRAALTVAMLLMAASAARAADFFDVAKWSVGYDDALLGRVSGVAYCGWYDNFCWVRLRNPATGALVSLFAREREDFAFGPKHESVTITLHGPSPSGDKVAPPAMAGAASLLAERGPNAKITVGADSKSERAVEVETGAEPDRQRVRLKLEMLDDGALAGTWSYLASPITERDGDGTGRVGVFRLLSDKEIPLPPGATDDEGGFLGVQSGGEVWQPLPAQIAGVFVVEDQAAFDGSGVKYPHADGQKGFLDRNIRHLVVIGRDLSVIADRIVDPIVASDDASVRYSLGAIYGRPEVSDADAQQFERAFDALTKDMDADKAAEFRKLQAVMMHVDLDAGADAGRKNFYWGGGESGWDLQYGDNIAGLRFLRPSIGDGIRDAAAIGAAGKSRRRGQDQPQHGRRRAAAAHRR
jgi:hypothetical protein